MKQKKNKVQIGKQKDMPVACSGVWELVGMVEEVQVVGMVAAAFCFCSSGM